jgi:NAD(P)-dependent dehydrogenase (short-subunit alcohol dehydrogenase family)
MERIMKRLENRVALITGGASGIGKATAFRFINEGAKVVISDIQDAKGAEVEKELKALGGDAMYLHHDVSSEASWKEVLELVTPRILKKPRWKIT